MRYIEKLIAKQCVANLLKAGYAISVFDGEEVTLKSSTDRKAIMAALATTDEDKLFTYKTDEPASFVHLVWGNGCDLISDYGVSLEGVLTKANALAEKLEG